MSYDPIFPVGLHHLFFTQQPTPLVNRDFKKVLLPLTENRGRKNALKIIITGLFVATATLFLKTNLPVVPLIPCAPNVTAYRITFHGDCSIDQIREAFAQRDIIYDQRQIDLETNGLRMAEESTKANEPYLAQLEREKEESNQRLAALMKKYYPSPEEVASESLKNQREIHCQMEERLAHLPFSSYVYTSNCVKNEIKLLGGKMSDNCDTIKKLYREQSLLYHPDKNNSPDANVKFNSIAEAYKKICP